MSKELYWLTLTVAMTGLLWVPYILDRIMVRGAMGATANPSPSDKPQSAWAQRMIAAHTNSVENLVVFAPLVLTAQALNIHTASTAFACALFFCRRLDWADDPGAGDIRHDVNWFRRRHGNSATCSKPNVSG